MGIPGLQFQKFRTADGSGESADAVKGFNAQASADNVSGTPTVYVSKGSGPRRSSRPG